MKRIVSRDFVSGASDGVHEPEILSAELVHVESGIGLQLREGRVFVGGVVRVESFRNALELVREDS